MRGKPDFIAEHLKHDRITPAHAGKTLYQYFIVNPL